MNTVNVETNEHLRENPLVQDIKERIRQLAIQDKQEGAQDRYIFEEPSSFMQRERTCAKYIGKVSHRKYRFYRKYQFGTNVQKIFFSLIAILFAIWKLLIAFKSAKTDLSTSTTNILKVWCLC